MSIELIFSSQLTFSPDGRTRLLERRKIAAKLLDQKRSSFVSGYLHRLNFPFSKKPKFLLFFFCFTDLTFIEIQNYFCHIHGMANERDSLMAKVNVFLSRC